MKANFEKAGIYIMQVILTAIVSALIAILQVWLEHHGVKAGPTITPENASTIGLGVGSLVHARKFV